MTNDKQPKLIQNLNSLERIFSGPISQKKLKKVKTKIFEIILYLDQNITKLSDNIVLQILEFLGYYNEKMNFSELLHDYKPSYLVNINLAYIIQQRWKYQRFQELTHNTDQIQNAIKVIKEVRSDLDKEDEDGFFEFMKFDFVLTKSYLQLAASHSQFNDHKKALNYGKQAIKFLNSLCQKIETLLTKQSSLGFDFSNMKKARKLISENRPLFNQFLSFFIVTKKISSFIDSVFPVLVSD